jgi:hypothetical protein
LCLVDGVLAALAFLLPGGLFLLASAVTIIGAKPALVAAETPNLGVHQTGNSYLIMAAL